MMSIELVTKHTTNDFDTKVFFFLLKLVELIACKSCLNGREEPEAVSILLDSIGCTIYH